MSTEYPYPQQSKSGSIQMPSPEVASLENFVRLQQSQSEYLAWLEANEKRPEMDRYFYRKIR
jgi:hypothetical protein